MRKKKSRFGYYLYAVVALVLTIANITIAGFLLFYVQKIEISGNTYSKSSDILKWIKEDPYVANSLYAFVKFKAGAYEEPVYLEKVTVGLSAPWALDVKVKEKQIIGGISEENEYVYFDREGLVLSKGAEKMEGIPFIEGLEAERTELYQKLSVQDQKVFSYIVSIQEELQKQKLHPDRISWEENSMNLYFEGVCVRFGKSRFDEKMIQLPPILEKLEGKKGVLHLEYYNQTSKNISFEQSVE